MSDENRCPQCGAELAADAPARALPRLPAEAGAGDAHLRQPEGGALGGSADYVPPTPGRVGTLFPRPGDPGTGRPRRDGRGLQGPAEAARPAGGAENPLAQDRPRSGLCRAVRPRGPGDGHAQPSAHRGRLRFRPDDGRGQNRPLSRRERARGEGVAPPLAVPEPSPTPPSTTSSWSSSTA